MKTFSARSMQVKARLCDWWRTGWPTRRRRAPTAESIPAVPPSEPADEEDDELAARMARRLAQVVMRRPPGRARRR